MKYSCVDYPFCFQAVINEDVTGNVTELQMEIKKLKDLVSQLRGDIFMDIFYAGQWNLWSLFVFNHFKNEQKKEVM